MSEGLYSSLLAGSSMRPDPAAESFAPSNMENPQGGRLHSHPRQRMPLLDRAQGEKQSCSPACQSPDCLAVRAAFGNSMKAVHRKERG